MNMSRNLRFVSRGINHKNRHFSLASKNCAVPKSDDQSDWGRVVQEAEAVVGYPTSFLSLRWLLNDEIANIAMYIRRLIGTNHPLIKAARNLLMKNGTSAWGLVVLLVSKAGGINTYFNEAEHDRTTGILHSQRMLAEITEMLRTSNLIHKGLINIDKTMENKNDLYYGNKIALLSGDYLLSTSYRELARIKDFELNESISSCLRDLSECEFVGLRDVQNKPLPTKPFEKQTDVPVPNEITSSPLPMKNILGNCKSEWTFRAVLGGGSLLGKSCRGALKLAGHGEDFEKIGYLFGRNLALSWQAAHEYDRFMFGQLNDISLVSAPVLLHLEHDPEFYRFFEGCTNVENLNFDEIRSIILKGPAIDRTLQMKIDYAKEALILLNHFNNSQAKDALVNIVNAL